MGATMGVADRHGVGWRRHNLMSPRMLPFSAEGEVLLAQALSHGQDA